MTRTGALPKYIAVAEGLTRDIRAGRYAVGSRLPGERDMAQTYGISVGTLRRALAELDDRGLLRRVQGSGNYVEKSDDGAAVYAFFRLEHPTGGGLPTARVLDVKYEDAWIIRRVRALDGADIALEEITVQLPKSAGLDQLDLSDSLYRTYRAYLGVFITQAEDHVTVGNWPNWGPALCQGACGFVQRRASDRDGKWIEQSKTWYAPELAVYTSRIS